MARDVFVGFWVYLGQNSPLQQENQPAQSRAELAHAMGGSSSGAQPIPNITVPGPVAQENYPAQELFAWSGKLASLDDQTVKRITEAIARDPRNRAEINENANYLAGRILDALA